MARAYSCTSSVLQGRRAGLTSLTGRSIRRWPGRYRTRPSRAAVRRLALAAWLNPAREQQPHWRHWPHPAGPSAWPWPWGCCWVGASSFRAAGLDTSCCPVGPDGGRSTGGPGTFQAGAMQQGHAGRVLGVLEEPVMPGEQPGRSCRRLYVQGAGWRTWPGIVGNAAAVVARYAAGWIPGIGRPPVLLRRAGLTRASAT